MISVLIPTKNEELDLPACLASVSWSDDVHVYDSASTDRTVEIAHAHGAHLVTAPAYADPQIFGGNESLHRNWALRNIPFKYPWVLLVDADERITPELSTNLQQAVKNPGTHIAFLVQRRDFFQQTWLKHVQATPEYMRLFRPEKMSYRRLIHPVSVPDGPVGRVNGYIDHYPFSKGLAQWINRHNAYSTLEALEIINNSSAGGSLNLSAALFAPEPWVRRSHQKEIFQQIPFRPLLKFVLLYFLKRGFLDGRAGFTYAVLQSFYEYMIILKTRELRRNTSQVR